MTDLINAVAFVVFVGGLALAALLTSARVIAYRVIRRRQPRLLGRDLIVMGGLALSFGMIVVGRVLVPDDVRLTEAWALVTDVPACVAVLTYLYFEIFVIERGAR